MAKVFLLTRDKRAARELQNASIRDSFLSAVVESAAVNRGRERELSAIAGSTRHTPNVRCANTAARPNPSTRVRCKNTTRASSKGIPRNA